MRAEKRFYSFNTREGLVGYCELHCQTERALFRKDMVAQMIEYAGRPKSFCSPEEIMNGWKGWYSLGREMEELVKLARENKDYNKHQPIKRKEHLSLVVDNERRITQA